MLIRYFLKSEKISSTDGLVNEQARLFMGIIAYLKDKICLHHCIKRHTEFQAYLAL